MTAPGQDNQAAARVIRLLRTMHQLTLEALGRESRQSLVFQILNGTHRLAPYNRAAMFRLRPGKARLLGVSGQADINERSPLAEEWRGIVGALADPGQAGVITEARIPGAGERLRRISEQNQQGEVFWLPLSVNGVPAAGVWLERWGGGAWSDDDRQLLQSLAPGYAAAWERHGRSWPERLRGRQAWRLKAVAFIAAFFLLFFSSARLRVVAPCEIVARDPIAVSAPLNGVIEEIVAAPGSYVRGGTLLFRYDKRISMEEVKIVRQQVEIIEAKLERARVEAFTEPSARAELQLLQARLEQERLRLGLAESQLEKLDVHAPSDGLVIIDDLYSWRGRAVRVGERVMTLVNPVQTLVKIWVPEDDNIAFNPDVPVQVVLNVRPADDLEARIIHVARHVQLSPGGAPSFVVEAEWADPRAEISLGLKGTAVLYGEPARIAYWLLRKPLAAVRRFCGI